MIMMRVNKYSEEEMKMICKAMTSAYQELVQECKQTTCKGCKVKKCCDDLAKAFQYVHQEYENNFLKKSLKNY